MHQHESDVSPDDFAGTVLSPGNVVMEKRNPQSGAQPEACVRGCRLFTERSGDHRHDIESLSSRPGGLAGSHGHHNAWYSVLLPIPLEIDNSVWCGWHLQPIMRLITAGS
jgi:hypothetical protein